MSKALPVLDVFLSSNSSLLSPFPCPLLLNLDNFLSFSPLPHVPHMAMVSTEHDLVEMPTAPLDADLLSKRSESKHLAGRWQKPFKHPYTQMPTSTQAQLGKRKSTRQGFSSGCNKSYRPSPFSRPHWHWHWQVQTHLTHFDAPEINIRSKATRVTVRIVP